MKRVVVLWSILLPFGSALAQADVWADLLKTRCVLRENSSTFVVSYSEISSDNQAIRFTQTLKAKESKRSIRTVWKWQIPKASLALARRIVTDEGGTHRNPHVKIEFVKGESPFQVEIRREVKDPQGRTIEPKTSVQTVYGFCNIYFPSLEVAQRWNARLESELRTSE